MKNAKKIGAITSFLGHDASLEGTLEFKGTIRLDGRVKGKIFGNGGTVIIGDKAVIQAEMVVDQAIIMGEVTGNIDAKERIEVYPPGKVMGDIQSPIISIETGAVFTGNCGMKTRKGTGQPFSEATQKI